MLMLILKYFTTNCKCRLLCLWCISSILARMLSRRMTPSLPGCLRFRRLLSSAASPVRAACLEERSAILVSGQDAGKFLQGLVTQDVLGLVHPVAQVQYAHILNAKGRTKYDVMIYPQRQPDDTIDYLLEADRLVLEPLQGMLKMHRMRAKVEFGACGGEWTIWTLRGDDDAAARAVVPADGRAGPDPRMAGFHRLALPASSSASAPPQDGELAAEYARARARHGLCEGSSELPPDDALPLEHNLDLCAGVCFQKGCYVGQELTARTHFTGVVRKRALPVRLLAGGGGDLSPGLQLASRGADGRLRRAGKLRAWFGDCGIAAVPLDLARKGEAAAVLCLKTGDEGSSTLAIGEMSDELEKAVADAAG